MTNIPFPESAPDIVNLAFKEIDRKSPEERAQFLSRLHRGVVNRSLEMIPVDHGDPAANQSVRRLSREIERGGNWVASAEIHRPRRD
jgi:hypothetical protein